MKRKSTLIFLIALMMVIPAHSLNIIHHGSEIAILIAGLSNGKIKGKVMDKEGTPIANALVTELNDIYSNNIVQCDSTGYFEITVDTNSATLMVSAIGYLPRKLESDEFKEKDGLKICLDVNPDFTIEGVEVVAKRKVVTVTSTGLIYNMNDNPLKSEDALEALRFVPLVTVQGNLISIVGKSTPDIYVNERQLKLSGESLLAYLKALSADNIETVEVIRNPNAKYKGANSVLSIKLKGREDEGLKGFLNGQIWKTHNVKEMGNITLDYTKGKWCNMFSIYAGNYRNYKEISTDTYYLKENYTISSDGIEKSKVHNYGLNFMGVYQFSETKNLGINVSGNLNDEDGKGNDLTYYHHTNQFISTLSENMRKKKNIIANLNYQYHAKDGKHYLIADVDYLYNTNKQDVINEMNNVDQQGSSQSLYLKEWQEVPQNSSVYSAKVEYGGKFGDGFNFDFGADAYYSDIQTNNKYMGWKNNDFVLDSKSSYDFTVKEFTPTLFLDLSKKWEKFYTSVGTLLEYTQYKGEEHRQNETFETDFFRVLPQLNVHYQISKKHSVGYSASYSLQRPSFDLLNPFIVRVSPTEYSVGNPYLQPTKDFSQGVNYNFNNRHSFYLQHQLTNDMQNIIQRAVNDGMIENKPENVGRLHSINWGYSTYLTYLNQKGSFNFSADYIWKSMKGNSEVGLLSYHQHSAVVNFNNSFLLFPHQNIRFNLGGDYYSKQRTMYAEYPHNISFRTELNARIYDISVTLYYYGMFFFNDEKVETSRKIHITNDFLISNKYTGGEAFQVGLRLSYSFGNKKVKQLQQRSTSNSNVKGRVK